MIASETRKCRVTAMDLLSRREHSSYELQKKLLKRDYASQIITEVLSVLRTENLLSDERFTECYIRSKSNRGIGPQRLSRELREHCIEKSMIAPYLAEYSWLELAAEAREKRFGPDIPSEYKDKARQMRFLQYRGFSLEQINSVMRQE